MQMMPNLPFNTGALSKLSLPEDWTAYTNVIPKLSLPEDRTVYTNIIPILLLITAIKLSLVAFLILRLRPRGPRVEVLHDDKEAASLLDRNRPRSRPVPFLYMV